MSPRTRRTYSIELIRAVPLGFFETAVSTFFLLVAVVHFQSGPTAKAILASGQNIGLLLSLPFATLAASRGWTSSGTASIGLLLGGCALILAAMVENQVVFVVCSAIGAGAPTLCIPVMTKIFQENYPREQRGKLFSRTVIVRIISAAAFSFVAGIALTGRVDQYPWLMLTFAFCLLSASALVARIPCETIPKGEGVNPLRAFRHLKLDPEFRLTLISWMVAGMGLQMMVPLRVEYLANPRYGFDLDAAQVALLTAMIPSLTRALMSPLWGKFFDQFSFPLVRIGINCTFLFAVLSFFTGTGMVGLVVGALVFGAAMAGGEIAFSLWVTKLAKPQHVTEYMAVHTFLGGFRGLFTPFLAFYLAAVLPMTWVATIAMGLILAGTLLLFGNIRLRPRRKGTPLTKDIAE